MKSAIGSLVFASVISFQTLGPQISRPLNGPSRVTWADGREAELKIASIDPYYIKLPIKVFENLCRSVVRTEPVTCEAHFGFKAAKAGLEWTKNPDPKKIGKPVRACKTDSCKDATDPDFQALESRPLFASETLRKLLPEYLRDLGADEIICNDYGWLPGGSQSAPPEKLNVYEWTTELAFINFETGRNENVAFGAASQLEFSRTTKNTIRVGNVQFPTTRIPDLPALLYATSNDIAFYVPEYKGEPNELCQISLKANRDLMGDAAAIVKALEKSAKPYVKGADAITDQLAEIVLPDSKVDEWFDFTVADKSKECLKKKEDGSCETYPLKERQVE